MAPPSDRRGRSRSRGRRRSEDGPRAASIRVVSGPRSAGTHGGGVDGAVAATLLLQLPACSCHEHPVNADAPENAEAGASRHPATTRQPPRTDPRGAIRDGGDDVITVRPRFELTLPCVVQQL